METERAVKKKDGPFWGVWLGGWVGWMLVGFAGEVGGCGGRVTVGKEKKGVEIHR